MAFSSGGGGSFSGRGSRFRNSGGGALAEINIIPLVDVVLVLLIIFMLTAHVMEFGLEIEVPKVRQVKDTSEDFPVVSINRDGLIYLGEKPANINVLGEEIHQRYPNSKGVFLKADKGTVWDPIAQVVSALGEAKLDVRVVTQPDDQGDQPRKR